MLNRLRWWKYYYVARKLERIVPWIARKLPRKIKYWVVIDAMAHYTVVVNPQSHPDDVKGWDLLNTFDTRRDDTKV